MDTEKTEETVEETPAEETTEAAPAEETTPAEETMEAATEPAAEEETLA